MAMSSLRFLYFYGFLLCFASLLTQTRSQGDESRQPNKHVTLFVFGDSVYDPGNNDYLNISIGFKANFPPYGETFFKYPTGRFCDGRLIPDFMAINAKLPLWKPYLDPGYHNFANGANFASGGAGALVETNPGTINLGKQLSYFKKVTNLLRQSLGDAEAKQLLMKAVYLSSIGGVGYVKLMTIYPNSTESNMQEYVKMVIGNLTNVLKEIYEMGGRKFAFQNVAPLGCVPLSKQIFNISGDNCVEQLLSIAKLHNNALYNITKEWDSQLPGFKYLIFDYYNLLADRIKNPSKYGFKVGDTACCGIGTYRGTNCRIEPYELCSNPNEYLFFDGEHCTEHGCSQLAEQLWNGAPNVTRPYNMRQLFELEPIMEISSEEYSSLDEE